MVVSAVTEKVDVLCPAEFLEIGFEIISISTWRKTSDRNLIRSNRRRVARENMRSFIPHIGSLDRHRVGQLILNGRVPGVHGRQLHFVRKDTGKDVIWQEKGSVCGQ